MQDDILRLTETRVESIAWLSQLLELIESEALSSSSKFFFCFQMSRQTRTHPCDEDGKFDEMGADVLRRFEDGEALKLTVGRCRLTLHTVPLDPRPPLVASA